MQRRFKSSSSELIINTSWRLQHNQDMNKDIPQDLNVLHVQYLNLCIFAHVIKR